MKNHVATEQLLVSDAIERAVDQFDYSPLANATVYLDTQYISKVTSQGFLNNDYIRSALRERLMAANCKVKKSAEEADYVVEVRVGALGTDAHEINYGIPAMQPITTTASLLAGGSAIPALPEVSLAKKDERRGAAKLYLFAYKRDTMEAVWQPGVSHGRSTARSMWVLGAGPFEKGTIYDHTRFAGAPLENFDLQPLDVESLPTLTDLTPFHGEGEDPERLPSKLARLLLPGKKRATPARKVEEIRKQTPLERRVDEMRLPPVAAQQIANDDSQADGGDDESKSVEKASFESADIKDAQP